MPLRRKRVGVGNAGGTDLRDKGAFPPLRQIRPRVPRVKRGVQAQPARRVTGGNRHFGTTGRIVERGD